MSVCIYKVPKGSKNVDKGSGFQLYLAFMTIYMQRMIKIKALFCVEELNVSDVCMDLDHIRAALSYDTSFYKQTQSDTISHTLMWLSYFFY